MSYILEFSVTPLLPNLDSSMSLQKATVIASMLTSRPK